METTDTITVGDYIVIQRQKYTKLHKFSSLESTAMLGKELLELRNIASKPYSTTFKMVSKNGAKGKRMSTLEPCTDKSYLTENIIASKGSGIDNRNITDDGSSQSLTPDEIQKLREECSSSTEIVSQIVENSKTFSSKTEYSQEKYLKKKEKKYFEFVQIKRPNIRFIADIMYRQSADKIHGMRMDQLSQLVSYSGVCGVGNYLLYESGTNGLLPATLLNSIGCNTEAKLVHMHPGNVPQKQALLALNLKQEQLDRCVSVNLYSVLRQYYQGSGPMESVTIPESGKHKLDPDDVGANETPPTKLLKLEDDDTNGNSSVRATKPAGANKEQWVIDNERACAILKDQVDGLIICSKEHPSTIVKFLLPFLRSSRPIVIYNTSREILADLYVEMKSTYSVTNLKITSNWMRSYQILPNRTHPEINMSGNSGFLLAGYTVR